MAESCNEVTAGEDWVQREEVEAGGRGKKEETAGSQHSKLHFQLNVWDLEMEANVPVIWARGFVAIFRCFEDSEIAASCWRGHFVCAACFSLSYSPATRLSGNSDTT